MDIPAEVCARLDTADQLSDEDRETIIEIARQALVPFQPKPEKPTSRKSGKTMSESAASLRHQIASAGDLESVVRTMKAMAASNIGQYENAVRSLGDYYRTVQLGLAACLRQDQPPAAAGAKGASGYRYDRRYRVWIRSGTGRPIQ